MQLCRVPAGKFWMGSDPPEGGDNEHPRRLVETKAYEIGETPVTNAEFAAFVGRYGERSFWSADGWAWREQHRIEKPRFWDDPDWRAYQEPEQPVVGVSWHEAEAFARFCALRLPSEAEWERAARGDDGRRFPWGDEWIPEIAAHRGGVRHTLPVKSFPRNRSPYGLYDCAGNVWEWCADDYHRDGDTIAARSAHGVPSGLKSARGGSWNAHPPQLRCASRNAWPPDARFSNLGFRVCR